ncbi:MAG: ParB N-terminal domain-containing protein, partial [Sulfitobacter sp.]|nr:ParB N-terminal domain-containing protein [Sulfitobacter sp.]
IKDVVRSIQAYGFRIPILVRTRSDGTGYRTVDGHVRLEAARRLGAEAIPCILVDDLSDVQVRRMSLSLNKLQETGEWDTELLKIEIAEIIEISGEIEIPGFAAAEIEALQFGVGEGVLDPADDISDIEPDDGPTFSKQGDQWILGDHRLFNGSARDGATIVDLLGGEAASACFTDPPYNVRINGNVRSAGPVPSRGGSIVHLIESHRRCDQARAQQR